MRTGVTVYLSPTDRKRLQAIVDDRNSPQKHVWRARIVLATADGLGTATIMRTAGVSKTAVWRWQERFMSEGVDGLLRDKTRPARIARLTDDVAERIVALTLDERRLKRGFFKGVVDLQAAINRFVADHNQQPKPFVWTADPDIIIADANRGHQVLDSIH